MARSVEERRTKEPNAQSGCDLLGRMVRRRRRQLRASQQRLADVSGVSQSVISRLETGKLRGIAFPRLGDLIFALGGLDLDAPVPDWAARWQAW